MDRKQRLAAKIKQARIENGLSQRDLGKLYGSSDVNISEIERGIIGISIPDLDRMAKILGKSIEWFISDKVEVEDRPVEAILAKLEQKFKRPLFREIPILGFIPCGYPLPTEGQAEGKIRVYGGDLGYAKEKKGLFALKASGDSLLGDSIHKGDLMVIDPTPPDYPDGYIYAVRINTDVTCKHVYRDKNKVRLVSSNHEVQEMNYNADDVENLGMVILSGNWIRHGLNR